MLDQQRDQRPFVPNRISEGAYLDTEGTEFYRIIARYAYEQYQAQRDWLTVDEIWAHVVRFRGDETYTREACVQHCQALAAKGTLLTEAGTSGLRSIEEIRQKRLLCQLSPVGVLFEELTCRIDEVYGGRAGLESALLDRLWSTLNTLRMRFAEGIPSTPSKDYLEREIRRNWLDAVHYFTELRAKSNQFHAALRRGETADLSETEAFLAYKDVLLDHLSGFVSGLAGYGDRIRALFAEWMAAGHTTHLVELIVSFETRYSPDATGRLPDSETVRSYYAGQVSGLADWFRRGGGVDVLQRRTIDAIETVVRKNQRLADRLRSGASREAVLAGLAARFVGLASDIEAAHRLAAQSLGCAFPRHIAGSPEWKAMDDVDEVWMQPPEEVALRPVRRGRRVQVESSAVRDTRAEQAAALEQERLRIAREAALWDELFRHGEVDLGTAEIHDSAVRTLVLDVVSRCLASADHEADALDGMPVRLLLPEPMSAIATIACEDGTLVTPRFRLQRLEDGARA